MEFSIKNLKLVGTKENPVKDQLNQILVDTAKKIKLEMPFKADGFKPERVPFQPDGETLVSVEKAELDKGSVITTKSKSVSNLVEKPKMEEKEEKKVKKKK